MLSAILSISGTGCLSMSGQALLPLPGPTHLCPAAGGAAAELMGGPAASIQVTAELPQTVVSPFFVCISETISVLWKLSVPSRAGIFICVYICSRVYIWSWCKGCIYGLTLLNMCHFTVPPCLLTLLPWEATEARSPLYVQENHPLPLPYGLQSHYWLHLQRMVIK